MNLAVATLLMVVCLPSVAQIDRFERTKGNDCSLVRLDQTVLKRFPVLDQGETVTCSAYVAAQLYDSSPVRRESGRQMTSPYPLAFEAARLTNRSGIADIPVLDYMSRLTGLHHCPTSIVRAETEGKRIEDVIQELLGIYRNASISLSEKTNRLRMLTLTSKLIADSGVQKINFGDAVRESTPLSFFNSLFEQACQGERTKMNDSPEAKILRSVDIGDLATSMEVMRRAINAALDATAPVPLGLSYCRTVLDSPGKSRYVASDGRFMSESCTAIHTSIVVGRRLLNYTYVKDGVPATRSVCQFLVRDTLGSNCRGQTLDSQVPGATRCEGGQYWVDEDRLLRNTGELFWVPTR